ncbi:hypothetical protein F4808DRAFT_421746 [Astrocystis sublimbata]|nr:hypothetical protein F4808DRAFT_421746 [Astrocystis sublimbata]
MEIRLGGTDTSRIERASALVHKAGIRSDASDLAGSCFWTHALMQLTHSLSHTAVLAWTPDSPGEVSADTDSEGSAGEVFWARRMVYICTAIANLHAGLVNNSKEYTRDQLLEHCERYRAWCDAWAHNVPRSMMPLCYTSAPNDQSSETNIPYILLVGVGANVSRLLYHTSCLLLAIITPAESAFGAYAQRMQTRHALDICGISAQAEDKQFTHVAACCLPIAIEALDEPKTKQEALRILDRLTRGTP